MKDDEPSAKRNRQLATDGEVTASVRAVNKELARECCLSKSCFMDYCSRYNTLRYCSRKTKDHCIFYKKNAVGSTMINE